MTDKIEFLTANHVRAVSEEGSEVQKARDEANDIKLVVTGQDCPNLECIIMLRAKNTGSWLMARGTKVIIKVLSGMEFFDFLCSCYNLTLPQPPEKM